MMNRLHEMTLKELRVYREQSLNVYQDELQARLNYSEKVLKVFRETGYLDGIEQFEREIETTKELIQKWNNNALVVDELIQDLTDGKV